jgi:hypothetical protein
MQAQLKIRHVAFFVHPISADCARQGTITTTPTTSGLAPVTFAAKRSKPLCHLLPKSRGLSHRKMSSNTQSLTQRLATLTRRPQSHWEAPDLSKATFSAS